MNPKVLNWIFALIAVGAIAFAGYLYATSANKANPPITETTALTTDDSSPATTALSSAMPTVLTSPSANRTLTATQPLAVPNQEQVIGVGGSLSSIAASAGVSINAISKLNGIADPNKVYQGQSIIIPDDATTNSLTILFVTNSNRSAAEKAKLASGIASVYSDPVTAAQSDAKGIYGLTSSTPYSVNGNAASDTTLSLTTTDNDKSVNITIIKNADGLWAIKKLIIQINPQTTATPSP